MPDSHAGAVSADHGALPAPATRRALDYVFVSSIHPIDAERRVVGTPLELQYVGVSDMAVQTRHVLETLASVLADAGSSLDATLKVEVHLTSADDFHEFRLVWEEFFPVDPPARTTLVVGDEHIYPGCRLNLHAVALHGTAGSKREVLNPAGVPDSMDAEHASWAVKAKPFVFVSAFPATDFARGVPVGSPTGFPFYGSDAQAQATYIIDAVESVCEAAGTSLDQAVKCQFYETNLANFYDIDVIWGQRMRVPPPRSSMACRGLLVPGAVFAANLMFLVPDDEHTKRETQAGLRWHPQETHKVNYTPGITAGNWLFTAGQIPVPDHSNPVYTGTPEGLPYYWSDIEVQTEFTMELLKEQLQGNDMSLADIVDARVYLIDPRRDFRGFSRAWKKVFAGVEHPPALSLIPSTQEDGGTGIMLPGVRVEIDLISLRETD